MKVAMPVWQGRISPVMDVASRLLITEYDGGSEVNHTEFLISGMLPPQVARQLAEIGVSVLICGGISRPFFSLIAAQGIAVIPWVMGTPKEILEAYNTDRLTSGKFMMPGCGRCRRGQGGNHGPHAQQGQGRRRIHRMGWRESNREMEIDE